jgi:hypothetical protein
LLYWNLADTDRVLDGLEEVDKISWKIWFSFACLRCNLIIRDWNCAYVLGFRPCWYLILGQRLRLRLWRVWGRVL